MIAIQCPRCHSTLVISTTIIDGETVIRCIRCGISSLMGSKRWYPDNQAIAAIRAEIEHNRREAATVHAIVTTDIDDPRWVRQ